MKIVTIPETKKDRLTTATHVEGVVVYVYERDAPYFRKKGYDIMLRPKEVENVAQCYKDIYNREKEVVIIGSNCKFLSYGSMLDSDEEGLLGPCTLSPKAARETIEACADTAYQMNTTLFSFSDCKNYEYSDIYPFSFSVDSLGEVWGFLKGYQMEIPDDLPDPLVKWFVSLTAMYYDRKVFMNNHLLCHSSNRSKFISIKNAIEALKPYFGDEIIDKSIPVERQVPQL